MNQNTIQIQTHNRTLRIRHLCNKISDLSCQRCLINTGVKNMNNI